MGNVPEEKAPEPNWAALGDADELMISTEAAAPSNTHTFNVEQLENGRGVEEPRSLSPAEPLVLVRYVSELRKVSRLQKFSRRSKLFSANWADLPGRTQWKLSLNSAASKKKKPGQRRRWGRGALKSPRESQADTERLLRERK